MTEHHTSQPARVFVIGATRIAEDPALSALSTEQVRALLRFSYPEIASATVRERVHDGLHREYATAEADACRSAQ